MSDSGTKPSSNYVRCDVCCARLIGPSREPAEGQVCDTAKTQTRLLRNVVMYAHRG